MSFERKHLRRTALIVFVAIACGIVLQAAEPVPVPAPMAEPPKLDPVPAINGAPPAAPIIQRPIRIEPLDTEPPPLSQKFVSDRIAVRKLELAKEKLADEDYSQAVRLIQTVLDRPHDGIIHDASQPGSFKSLKVVADRILAELPPAGRRAYEIQFGIGAQAELETALKAGDWEAIEQIARRFFHTTAGEEATYRLAMREIDRGKPLFGALRLDRLLQAGAERFEPQLTMRLLRSARRAELSELAAEARERWESMRNGGDGVAGFSDQGKARFAAWLKQAGSRSVGESEAIWATLAGARDGVAPAERVTVAGGVDWSYLFTGPDSTDGRDDLVSQKLARAMKQVLKNSRAMGDIAIPAFAPVIVGNVAIFRTFLDIRAVDLSTGRLLWRTAHARGPLLTQVIPQLSMLYEEGFQRDQSDVLRAQVYLSQYAFRNMTSGSITTDGRRVYALRGTGLARSKISISVMRGNRRAAVGQNPYNTLVAYDIAAEGRIAWTIGGPLDASEPSSGLYFLGPPLPVGGMLFAVAERSGEILLVAIDPDPRTEQRIVWQQPLAMANHALNDDAIRRLAGLTPSFANGLLICPTGAGAVVAVDLRDRTFRWGYRYARIAEKRTGPTIGGRRIMLGRLGGRLDKLDRVDRWIDAVPRIVGSSVLITPRDSDMLHCLDLATGQLRWTISGEGFYSLATANGSQVVLVGGKQIAAFDLVEGTPLWRSEFGVELRPSGRGLVTDGPKETGRIFYLPSADGRIYATDLGSGRIIASSELGDGFVPGNLAAVGGRMVSVSTGAVVGFRQISELEDLNKGGTSEAELAIRGEDRLMRGQIAAGIADLRAAVKRGGNERARSLLVNALLNGMRRDFPTYRDHAADVKSLLRTPGQHIEFARIYAEGLAASGESVAAARTLLELCQRGIDLSQFEHMGDQWRSRLDGAIRAELGVIYDNAAAENKQTINGMIRGRLEAIRRAGRVGELAKLATLAYGTGAKNDVLSALLERRRGTGDRLRALLLKLEMGEDSSEPTESNGDTTDKAPATGGETSAVNWQARYQPDALAAAGPPSPVPNTSAIRLVGSVPKRFAGWSFATDGMRQHVIAFDAFGRKRWRIAIGQEQRARGLPGSVDRFQARFEGPLLAIGLGRRLVALEVGVREEEPRLLWSKSMPVTSLSGFQINQFGMFEDAGSRPPRFGFAGPRVIVYGGNDSITAVDSVTGEELWSIAGIREDADILGDPEYVALATTASDVKVYRTADGEFLQHHQEDVLAGGVAGSGTTIVRWEKREDEPGYTLRCYDLARRETEWKFSYPLGTMLRRVGTDRVAVLDPAAGELQVIRWTDGKVVFSTAIESNAQITAFSLWQTGDRWILLTQNNLRRLMGGTELGPPWAPFRGLMRGLDTAGRVVWSRELEQCSIHQSVPREISLIVALSHRRNLENGRLYWALELIDAVSGKTLITKERENFFVPMTVVEQPETRRIEVRVPAARFVLEPGPKTPEAEAGETAS